MLSALSLNNVALFKKQTVQFENGFNCLLGQSGAGKSILIDALSFALGQKANKGLVRSGESQLRVDAVFEGLSSDVEKFLVEQEIEIGDELIVTRTLNVDGKSSIKLNGFPITLKTLQSLSGFLVDFCGQHDSVGLLNVSNHLSILDSFGGSEIDLLKNEVLSQYELLKCVEEKIANLGGNEAERTRTKDLLKFQIDEIESANLQIGEDVELKERFEFISSSESIYETVNDVLKKLELDNTNATMLIYESKNLLSNLSHIKEIDECRERLENSYYELKDIADTLSDIKQKSDFDPREFERIDERLDLIKKFSRKYGKTVEDILQYLDDCKQKLDELENSEFVLEKLQHEKEVVEKNLDDVSQKLSDCRKKYAKIFENEIMKELDDLEMKGTIFKIDFEKGNYSKKGFDLVKFMFSANKGQDTKDLHKTASGGELSRLMLAFKNIMLEKEKVQTVVFDEIDSGISGRTAGKLAEKLENISKFIQVVCITHTPVVASKANSFLLVSKGIVGEETISTAKTLDESESVVELARLIDGGTNVSDTAIGHAKKLLGL